MHLEQAHENKTEKTAVEAKINLKHSNHFVGAAFTYDLADFSDVRLHAVIKEGSSKYFARTNLSNRHASVGCTIRGKAKGFSHSYEAFYHWDKDTKGLLGHPISV